MNAALDDYVECLTADVSCEPGVNATCTSAYTIGAGGTATNSQLISRTPLKPVISD